MQAVTITFDFYKDTNDLEYITFSDNLSEGNEPPREIIGRSLTFILGVFVEIRSRVLTEWANGSDQRTTVTPFLQVTLESGNKEIIRTKTCNEIVVLDPMDVGNELIRGLLELYDESVGPFVGLLN